MQMWAHLLSWRFVISPKGAAVPAMACMAKVWYPRADIFAVHYRRGPGESSAILALFLYTLPLLFTSAFLACHESTRSAMDSFCALFES